MGEWNGYPENLERDGWHWLHDHEDGHTYPFLWNAESRAWVGQDIVDRSDWSYLGPCLTPAEVAVREQAASSVACRMNAGELVKVMRLERRVQRQRRALSRLYARRHEWKEREQAARREGMEKALAIVVDESVPEGGLTHDEVLRRDVKMMAAIRAAIEKGSEG